jgi:hypothetical protein
MPDADSTMARIRITPMIQARTLTSLRDISASSGDIGFDLNLSVRFPADGVTVRAFDFNAKTQSTQREFILS